MDILHKILTGNTILAIGQCQNGVAYKCLSTIEQQEYDLLHHPRRQQERLASLYILHEILHIPQYLYHTQNGQPKLRDSSIHISISHSCDGAVGVALHPSQRIGIDIENKKRTFAALRQRFLSDSEQAYIIGNELCGIAWCTKEAAYKTLNITGLDLKHDITLQPFTTADSRILADIRTPQPQTMTFSQIPLPEHWAVVTHI